MSDFKKVFPTEESGAENISNIIDINKDSAGLIIVDNLEDGDCAILEVFVGDECDGKWIPFKDCCGQVSLNGGGSCCANFMILPLPMRYRIILQNEDDEHINDPGWL